MIPAAVVVSTRYAPPRRARRARGGDPRSRSSADNSGASTRSPRPAAARHEDAYPIQVLASRRDGRPTRVSTAALRMTGSFVFSTIRDVDASAICLSTAIRHVSLDLGAQPRRRAVQRFHSSTACLPAAVSTNETISDRPPRVSRPRDVTSTVGDLE